MEVNCGLKVKKVMGVRSFLRCLLECDKRIESSAKTIEKENFSGENSESLPKPVENTETLPIKNW